MIFANRKPRGDEATPRRPGLAAPSRTGDVARASDVVRATASAWSRLRARAGLPRAPRAFALAPAPALPLGLALALAIAACAPAVSSRGTVAPPPTATVAPPTAAATTPTAATTSTFAAPVF